MKSYMIDEVSGIVISKDPSSSVPVSSFCGINKPKPGMFVLWLDTSSSNGPGTAPTGSSDTVV